MTEIYNRPGLSELKYRIGTFGSFREAMLRQIASSPDLSPLTARQSDDYGIAAMEMWAYLGDILTFYQERYAQEAFLRTAVHRDSLARMGALLAYKPRPGAAAQTYVAFTVEADIDVELPEGLRIQSVPGPGEKPQKYETVEAVTARQSLNQMRIYPQPQAANPFAQNSTGGLVMPGADTSKLKPGEKLLLTSTSQFTAVEKDLVALTPEGSLTRLSFDRPMQDTWLFHSTTISTWKRKFLLFGHTAPKKFLSAQAGNGADGQTGDVMMYNRTTDYRRNDITYLDLDGVYEIKDNTRILIFYEHPSDPGHPANTWRARFATVTSSVPAVGSIGSASATFATATVTRIYVNYEGPRIDLDVNEAVIYEIGEDLPLWGNEYPTAIPAGSQQVLVPLRELGVTGAEALELFPRGRKLLLADGAGDPEVLTVTRSELSGDHLSVWFSPAISRSLATASAYLFGNVALATHGETVKPEVLGSGDPSQPGQRFTLKKAPVTFVQSAASDTGAANTLEIRVDGILWDEVESFYGQPPDARVYVTEVDEDGTMTVQFGDGVNGALLPRGSGNVAAYYRQGIGADGSVRAGTLATPLDRPKGLKSSTNPGAAIGGADPETAAELRDNMPATVKTFDRAVSLRDFEDLARSYTGVAKAKATWVWNGSQQVLHLTVAGAGGAAVDKQILKDFLDQRRDPHRGLMLDGFTKVLLKVQVQFVAVKGYDGDTVQASLRQAIIDYFAFDAGSFGQSIHLSDLYRALQQVEGVEALAIDHLTYVDPAVAAQHNIPGVDASAHLVIYPARPDPAVPGRVIPAELAWIDQPDRDIAVTRREQL